MATKKAKKAAAGAKKSNRLKKGSSLESVKPLTEMSIPYSKIEVKYSQH